MIATIAVGLIALFLLLRAVSTSSIQPSVPRFDPDFDEPSEELVRDLIEKGRKIDAIKAYRVLHKVGLAEAKDAVERMPRRTPEPVE